MNAPVCSPSRHSVPGGGKNSFLQILKVFLSIIKYDKLKLTILTRPEKQKLGQKLHFHAFYGLLKLENAWLTLDENGAFATNFLEIYVSKQHLNLLFTL